MSEKFPKNLYNEKKAQEEANKIAKIVGLKGKKEDYVVAGELLEEAGEIDKDFERSADDLKGLEIEEKELLEEKRVGTQDKIEKSGKEHRYFDNELDWLNKKLRVSRAKQRLAETEEEKLNIEQEINAITKDILKTQEAQRKFGKFLKDKFNKFPSDDFKSYVPGIDTIQLYRDNPDEKGDINALNIVVIYTIDGEQHSKKLKLFNDGYLAGRMPENSKINTDELYDNILYIGETINSNFFETIKGRIQPPSDIDSTKEGQRVIREQKEKFVSIDPRRIRFFMSQPDILFGLSSEITFDDEYRVFIFPQFLVLESLKIGNAFYIYNFETPIEVDPQRFKLPMNQRLTPNERQRIINEKWKPIDELTKKELSGFGLAKQKHPHRTYKGEEISEEEWEKKMQKILDEHRAESIQKTA